VFEFLLDILISTLQIKIFLRLDVPQLLMFVGRFTYFKKGILFLLMLYSGNFMNY
jgi:hypothetical protein